MIFSATVPSFIQNIASESMENPVMIDLVGDDAMQLPDKLRTKAIISCNQQNKIAHIQNFVESNRDKKIIIFCETKD
jgi:superfamily II DNA/RNA helicase